MSKSYRVIDHGHTPALTYPGADGKARVANPGDVVSDLPAASVDWLLRDGLIAPIVEKTVKVEAEKVESAKAEPEKDKE